MNSTEREAADFIEAHVRELSRLERSANLASWDAAVASSEDATMRSAEARAALKRLYSSAEDASRVKAFLGSGELRDPLLHRQMHLLDLAYTANQLPDDTIDELSRREAELEQRFYTFRAELEGDHLSDNELREVLRTETDNGRRRAAWEASKEIGARVAEPLRELVRHRNAAARDLGFDNYYSMALALQEIDEEVLFQLFADFRAESDAAFVALRDDLDEALARRFGIAPTAVRPWHWEDFFSQEAPGSGDVDLDRVFEGRDLIAIARGYFREIGLPVDDVLERSDLYEREGKDQHAFCTDIDREGDVRILCNMRENEKWMATLLHELGHAVYDAYIPRSLPYILRSPAHTLSTEAIAMLMGRLARDPEWLRAVVGVQLGAEEARDIDQQLRLGMLIAARWIMVMSHFERALYRDPDRADLNELWWDLVEDLQRVRRPEGRDEPDWAAKIHLSMAPVYYHNYLLGEFMASQLSATIRGELTSSHDLATRAVGDFLREQIFAHGASLHWDDLLVSATGERLTSRHFVDQFVEQPVA